MFSETLFYSRLNIGMSEYNDNVGGDKIKTDWLRLTNYQTGIIRGSVLFHGFIYASSVAHNTEIFR